MGKDKPCPIELKGEPCRKKWRTPDGLFAHLYEGHVKAELVKWIVDKCLHGL